MTWSSLIRKFELKALALLRRTVKGNAPCDSHPRLCVHCKRVRFLIRFRKRANFILVNTVRGIYVWNASNARVTVQW